MDRSEYTASVVGAFVYWIAGPPELMSDGDNVSDLVELQAPNQGDGHLDGISDGGQANVASLPTFGAASGEPGQYTTVASEPGTVLTNVTTIDPDPAAGNVAAHRLSVSPCQRDWRRSS